MQSYLNTLEIFINFRTILKRGLILGLSISLALIAGLSIGFIVTAGLSTPSLANEILTPDRTQVNPPSKALTIDYIDLNKALKGLVMTKGPSNRRRPDNVYNPTGTRVSFVNKSMTRLESNRVMFHLLKDDHKQFVHMVRQSLEALPNEVPLRNFNRSEQLAYWLNLRNITVIEALMDKYPITRLKKFWENLETEKKLTISGQPMSIKDIEDHIVTNWPRAHVIYGFYNGAVGGPNIRVKAYTGKNVWNNLARNATEFINSLRGIQFRGKTTKVAAFYERYPGLFPDFKADLQKHIKANLQPDLAQRMSKTSRLRVNINDWHIADLMNGKVGLSSAGSIVPNGMAMYDGFTTTGPAQVYGELAFQNNGAQRYPAHVRAYLSGMKKRYQTTQGKVTIEEVTKPKEEK